MSRVTALVVGVVASILVVSPVANACGDKFMMAGRGPKFQRVYASVYPGKVLIYAKPSSDRKAAILNPQLHKVLRQAGHAVTVVENWPQLEQAMTREVLDAVLVDVNDAATLAPLLKSSRGRPEAMCVASAGTASPAPGVVCRLKASDGERKYLDEIEDVMKARTKLAKAS
jgi:hypothetical protein